MQTIGKKGLVMVNFIIHGMLLYAKQVVEYLLVILVTIVFKCSIQMVNTCLNLDQEDQKMVNSNVHVDWH